jgi:hypothetical protein
MTQPPQAGGGASLPKQLVAPAEVEGATTEPDQDWINLGATTGGYSIGVDWIDLGATTGELTRMIEWADIEDSDDD